MPPVSSHFQPRKDYSDLPAGFSDAVCPAGFPETKLRYWNDRWANRVGLGELKNDERVNFFARFEALPGAQPSPLAMRYHGHQFRHYNSQLGDGRGFLYAQCTDPVDRRLLDFGTKGSGTTPYSRAGDGRLTLKGAVREALATEMLEALGVGTSKTFSFFETGEALHRGDEPSPTRAAVLTRLSYGHIRYGTFQRFAAVGESENLRKLLQYSAATYFPELVGLDEVEIVFAFQNEVMRRAADLAASWMIAGFVHGVLNTDNMNITGESFDYGPWRFLPHYDPGFTAAYFDHEGLYSYARQPEAVYWNLDQIARALFTLVPAGEEQVWQKRMTDVLEKYPELFKVALTKRFFARLGMTEPTNILEGETIFTQAFTAMGETGLPFEMFFYDLYAGRRGADSKSQVAAFTAPVFVEFFSQCEKFGSRGTAEAKAVLAGAGREYYSRGRPETMLIDEVESIWDPVAMNDDWSVFNRKIESVRERGRIHGFGI